MDFCVFASRWHVCRQVRNSTGQRTPAIYQSYLPDGRITPHTQHIVHVHEHIKTHSTLQLMRRWTFDLDIELSQPASHWARPVNIDDGIEVITCIRCLGGERFAHGVLCSSPTPEQTFFSLRSSSERRGIDTFCRLFSTHQPTTHLRSRYRINSRSTRFVSGKAS